MNRSFHLGAFKGIPIKIHWTFGLIVLFIIYVSISSASSISEMIFVFLAFVILFVCVIFHEFGHALTARYFGVKTRDIIISPIGGVARLESLPKDPIEEFYIAVAGPAVNVVLAILISFVIILGLKENPFLAIQNFEQLREFRDLISFVLIINLALFLFNLIPAFPMDGGRILRSLLSTRIGRVRSTKISSWIGRAIAILFVIFGIWEAHLILAAIGVFIFYMARQEYRMILVEERLKSTELSSLFRKDFTRIKASDPMSLVFEAVKNSKENSFLVFDHLNNAIGILHQYFIESARKKNAYLDPVAYYTSDRLLLLNQTDSVDKARNIMQKKGLSIIGIKEGDELVGVVDRSDIIRFMKSL